MILFLVKYVAYVMEIEVLSMMDILGKLQKTLYFCNFKMPGITCKTKNVMCKKIHTAVVFFIILNLNTNSFLPYIWLEERGLSFCIHQTTSN